MEKQEIQRHRAEQYGRMAAILDRDHEVPGAAALFDFALSCGLAAIVSEMKEGAELRRDGGVKSARELVTELKDLAQEFPGREGEWVLAGVDGGLDVTIEHSTLMKGIKHAAGVRHARGVGELERRYVDALLQLDSHASLLTVLDELRDSDWVKEQIRQRHDGLRALEYLELIGEEEAERRAEAAGDFGVVGPGEVDDGATLDECPVCGRESLAVSGVDPFGAGVGSGACFVCSYVRSLEEAEDLARDIMMGRHAED